jgi:hypothetical protein
LGIGGFVGINDVEEEKIFVGVIGSIGVLVSQEINATTATKRVKILILMLV